MMILKFKLIKDDWLSKTMAKQAHQLVLQPESFDANVEIEQTLRTANSTFAFCKIPVFDLHSAHLLTQAGFRLVDTAITLECSIASVNEAHDKIRHACHSDRDDVVHIARTNMKNSRFHMDPFIPEEIADNIKSEWADNFFKARRGDAMVVAEYRNCIVGFLLLLENYDTLDIDLIAVNRFARRQGLASGMIRFAQTQRSKAYRMRVGTQAANTASLNLYEALGFRIAKVHYVFHWHAVNNIIFH
jgi:ribosomal protein S18 acetylase RimI-like enzyme